MITGLVFLFTYFYLFTGSTVAVRHRCAWWQSVAVYVQLVTFQVRFVKDLRRHGTEKLLNEKWEKVFGPALCIFNDAYFTPRDMQGIQALGLGSKEGDALKTGK